MPPATAFVGDAARFHAVFRQQLQFVALLAPDGRVLDINDLPLRVAGLEREAVVGRLFWDTPFWSHLPEMRAGWPARLAAAAQADGPVQSEDTFATAAGEVRTADAAITAVRDAGGAVEYFVIQAIDTTARRRTEAALQTSQARLRLAMHASQAGTFDWNARDNVNVWSDELLELYGFGPGEFDGTYEAWHACVVAEDKEPAAAAVRHSLETGIYSVEFRIRHRRTGEVRWMHGRGQVFHDDAHQPLRMVGINVDITARKQADEALAATEERFRTLADNIAQLAWMADPQGWIFWYNQRWYDYTGTTFEEMQGWGWKRVHHPDHLPRMLPIWQGALARGEGWEDTFPLRGADGHYRWFLSRAHPVRDAAGRILRWFGTNTDITEQREATELLAVAKEQAEAASRAKDNFLAALSHELRTPLTPVLMTATALESDPALSADLRGQLGVIRRNVELEARLIDDLLDLTRVTRGKLRLLHAPADIHTLLQQTEEIVRSESHGRQVALHFDLRAEECWVEGDGARLQQVFWNLIKNALKFTPAEGRVTVRSENPASGRLRVTVEDTGRGIEPDRLEHIFAPFDQGSLTGREQYRYGGLGLGLAIAKAIVDLHGGQIHARSGGSERGSAFTVELATRSAPPGVGAATPSPADAALQPLRLLLVEDHAPTLAVLERLLRRAGHRVTTAMNVADAVRAMESSGGQTFDLLISDIGLPDGSGLDLFTALRARQPDLPGVALSGYGMEEDVARSRAAGFCAHLVKPVNFDQLRLLLARCSLPANRCCG